MRPLRLWLIIATLVSLPGYGPAAQLRGCPGGAAAGAAPAAHAAHAAHAPADGAPVDATASSDDCCAGAGGRHAPDRQSQGKGDGCTACLAGHGCKSAQGVQSIPVPLRLAFPGRPVVIAAAAADASLCGPDDLLRPPDPA